MLSDIFKKKIWIISLLVFATGCAGSLKIRDINADPAKYHEKTVTVKGKVVENFSIPIISIGVAKINDGTGEIWVKPANRTLFEGQKTTVKGTFKIGLNFGSRSFGQIIVEGAGEENKK